MFNVTNIIISVMIAVVLGIAEYFLAKKDWRLGLILPIVTFISAIFFGIEFLLFTAVVLIVYAITLYIHYKGEKKRKEIDKMNIQDLE